MGGGTIVTNESSSRARGHSVSPRRAPKYVLGGSLHPAPNGYLATIQTTSSIYPAPMVIAELWPTIRSKRFSQAWNGIEPEGALVIYWTPRPTRILCGQCGKSLGKYRAYQAGGEYGVVSDTPRRYHSPDRHPPGTLKQMPQDRQQAARPVFWLTGEVGFRATKTFAHFRCTVCDVEYEANLRRLGQPIWQQTPETYRVQHVVRRRTGGSYT